MLLTVSERELIFASSALNLFSNNKLVLSEEAPIESGRRRIGQRALKRRTMMMTKRTTTTTLVIMIIMAMHKETRR